MKNFMKMFMVTLLAVVLVALTSCGSDNDDPKVSKEYTYTIGISGSANGTIITDSETSGIRLLYQDYMDNIKLANTTLFGNNNSFTITGQGETEAAAMANADQQAETRLLQNETALKNACNDIAEKFVVKRKALASQILTEEGRSNINSILGYYLNRLPTLETIKGAHVKELKAKAGQDYSN